MAPAERVKEWRYDWGPILVALVYSVCWSICATSIDIQPKPKADPIVQPPPADSDDENNYYYPDCEDWEDIEA